MKKEYDIIIIGGGPGGYVAAIKAAQNGLTAALIEKENVGGTCLNCGCIPTKSLVHTSHLWTELSHSAEYGIEVGKISYNIEKMYAKKDQVVNNLREGVEFLLNSNKVDLIRGSASITGNNTVKIYEDGSDRELSAKNILIATGSVPLLPPIEGISLPNVITSNEILNQPGTKYKSLVIIGGGVIGVEFATIFNALGCEVTIIEAMDRLLPTMDREISQNLNMILKKRGIKICTAASVEKVKQNDNRLEVIYSQKGKEVIVSAEAVLVAIGRKAYIENLVAQNIDIQVKRGIIVNENFETSIPGIYAIGDVIEGAIQLAHVASAQGIFVIDHICENVTNIDLKTVPSCIYTDPEIASVGMDAATAKQLGILVKTGKFTMTSNAKSVIEQQDRGFVKLIFDMESEVILGAQLMCARATDLVSELSTAIVNKLTISQLSSVIRPHPTFTEGITEAVDDVNGSAIHIIPKRKK
jgi:dihydrolipoamide dehydrogenase